MYRKRENQRFICVCLRENLGGGERERERERERDAPKNFFECQNFILFSILGVGGTYIIFYVTVQLLTCTKCMLFILGVQLVHASHFCRYQQSCPFL